MSPEFITSKCCHGKLHHCESGPNQIRYNLPENMHWKSATIFFLSTLVIVPFAMAMFTSDTLWQHFEKMLAGPIYIDCIDGVLSEDLYKGPIENQENQPMHQENPKLIEV